MEIVALLVLGAAIGFWIAQRMYLTALAKIVERLGISEQQLLDVAEELGLEIQNRETPKPQTIEFEGEEYEYDRYVEVRIEKIDDVLYAYEDETNVFIAQERDPNKLLERLITHFPKRTRVNIDPANGGEYLKEIA